MPSIERFLAVVVFALLPLVATGWSGHHTHADGLWLSIPEIAPVEQPSLPQPVVVVVSNGRSSEWRGQLRIEHLVDDWHCDGPDRFAIQLPAASATALSTRIRSGAFVFDALYPLHARLYPEGASTAQLHAVRIFEVRRPATAVRPPTVATNQTIRLPFDRAIALRPTRAHRFGWAYDGGPERFAAAPGWTGSDPVSRASIVFERVSAPDPRDAVGLHVPFEGGVGRAWVEWTVSLPPAGPVELRSATTIYHAGESARGRSDGIVFRAMVIAPPAPPVLVREEMCTNRQWQSFSADLSAWTGRTVAIRLECDPGPKRNTAFDQAWWAEPVLVAGSARELLPPPRLLPPQPEQTRSLRQLAEEVAAGRRSADGAESFALGHSAAAALRPGPAGLLDGLIALAAHNAGSVALAGLEVDVEGRPAGRYPSTVLCRGADVMRVDRGVRVRHRMADERGEFLLDVSVCAERGALRLAVQCEREVTALRLAPWDRVPARVYWGHGYVVEQPDANVWHAGGHGMASSHVGIEFEGGPAVLQGLDVPPALFTVDPARRVAAIETRMAGTLSLMVGRRAMDLAIGWRQADPRRAAPAVPTLAGRYVFDIWGGRFAEIETNLNWMVRYGLTNAVLIIHSWQRWGYDYRLPDIWPPDPQIGTIEDLRRIEALARTSNVLWGLHDNYIDFYPDAEGYSYRRIYFTADGRPHPAWYNEGRDARSYKWRPDAILPFVQRNVGLIRAHVRPTCSFVDVFASQPCCVWYDHEGRRHTPAEMRDHWGAAFDLIRRTFDGAPTTSEAGHDHLIGWLDGADCQWLRLTDEPRATFSIFTRARRWARVPWMDAAHHDRFVLYGAGYSSRFAAGRGRWHGINSDEYLAAEILGGHPPMTDAPSWGAAAVRKYWLMAEVARTLAMCQIVAHEFADDDIARQTVRWSNGSIVSVNLGDNDWSVGGHTLPPRGWYAATPTVTAAVERIGAHLVEWAIGRGTAYLSARTSFHEPESRPLRVRPSVSNLRMENGRLHYELSWDCRQSPGRNLTVFVHLAREKFADESGPTVAQDDHEPPRPTQEWSGQLQYERTMTLPPGLRGRHRLLVGLYNRWGRRRLEGTDDGELRIWVATLKFTPSPTGSPSLTVSAPPAAPIADPPGLNPEGTAVDIGWAATDGAFRLELDGAGGGRIVPLPGHPPCEIRLRPARLPNLADPRVVEGEPASDATTVPPVTFRWQDGELVIRHNPVFRAYRWAPAPGR
ncbi:MAG: hypothetical protein N2652_07495 [Kiritimatiellae bacterium]|nr:hypothetical protein [Kiritimatiellia bacterium]